MAHVNEKVKLISITPGAADLIVRCARVSNPENVAARPGDKLLAYCAKHKHWSIFEMADMTVEIVTSRAISAQILRHKSFSFQEFSQRYAEVVSTEEYPARRQDTKNRQNSIDDMDPADKIWFNVAQRRVAALSSELYTEALERGIAKEQARFLLPMSATTRLFMKGSIRSWLTYLQVRLDPSTQLEHRELAQAIQQILLEQIPVLSSILAPDSGPL